MPSLPSRERGLKPDIESYQGILILSLPSRERGLKLTTHRRDVSEDGRSPRGSVD